MTTKRFRYRLSQRIRRIMRRISRAFIGSSKAARLDIETETIRKILLVRANFRMGNSVLAAPAISIFRNKFPNAKIDLVGAPISANLFQGFPIDQHFSVTRRFPDCLWHYPALIKQLRSARYDLAVELSCSQSALGAFVVGLSQARFRVGLRGEWGRWYNVRIPRPQERNKYKSLPAFLEALGLNAVESLPSLALSAAEQEEAKKRIQASITYPERPVVGVFVGGRKTGDKRWPVKNFLELIARLYRQGNNVVTFFGPEEKKLMPLFTDALDHGVALVFEPSPRKFAGLVSNCDLFVSCDSGPMHLACAVGTRVVAIFEKQNFDRWGPPPGMARIVHQSGGCSVDEVLKACELEISPAVGSLLEVDPN